MMIDRMNMTRHEFDEIELITSQLMIDNQDRGLLHKHDPAKSLMNQIPWAYDKLDIRYIQYDGKPLRKKSDPNSIIVVHDKNDRLVQIFTGYRLLNK